jgi:hypothetical protein
MIQEFQRILSSTNYHFRDYVGEEVWIMMGVFFKESCRQRVWHEPMLNRA